MDKELIRKTGRILNELMCFDGQLEEMCIMSETEGEFEMTADHMMATLQAFIAAAKEA